MQTANPVYKITEKKLKRILLFLFFLTLILFVTLGYLDAPLKTTAAPNGIVSFELAGNFESAQNILASWNEHAKSYALKSLVIDYVFLISYSLFFAFLIFKTSRSFSFKEKFTWAKIGVGLGWLQFVAAASDALENYFLLRLLSGSQNHAFPQYASQFATVKFLLLSAGILYLLSGIYLRFKK